VPAPAAPDVVAAPIAPAKIAFVDIRIDSKPAGATAVLVDNGKTSFLGSTPLATSVDPSRKYDVIFTLPGRPTQMAPLDPAKTSKLDVTLSRGKSDRKKETTVAKLDSNFFEQPKVEAKKAEPKVEAKADAKAETKADAKAESAKAEPAKAGPANLEKKAATPAGEGTLMVSSKPPCEIVIDGKPTGLTTPQRSIPLSTGAHKITFVNATEGIKKTVSVSITADQSTKLIQDLMKK
jgi:hypothetical protein